MKVKITICLFALLMLTVCAGVLFAGTTGKLAGVITDAQTGEKLMGVAVVVKGTNLGAVSDIDGKYAVLNVPPGVYALEISMVGYQKLVYENVQVNIDLTTRIDVKLNQKAIEIGETIVVTAQRPLVVKDMTSSISTITSDEIRSLPVASVTDVLRLNAGIVESAGRLTIRGGRPGEVAYWVDGISSTDLYDGRMGVSVENSAVQEVQVVSGTFNAEYGQAMSGVINIITKSGTPNYTGQIKLYAGDYVSNDSQFGLYKDLVLQRNPKTGLSDIVSGDWENPLKKINPIYNGEFSLSGPVPMMAGNLSFFVNGRYFYNEGYFYGRQWYRPDGAPGNGALVPMNPNENISLQGKINFQLSTDIKMSYNVFWNKNYRQRNYYRASSIDYQFNPDGQANFNQFNVHDYKYVPDGLPQYFGEGLTHTFTLNHVLSQSTFYELRLSRYYSNSKQYVYADPYQTVKYLISVTADSAKGIPAETFDYSTAAGQKHLQEIIALGGAYTYVVDPNGPDGYIDPGVISAPTSYSFMNRGMDVTNTERSTAYWVGKFDLTSQFNKTNQFKAGAEVRLHQLILHSFQIIPATDANGQTLTPFLPTVPAVGNVYRNDYDRKPREISAYVQDKIEFDNIIVNIGLRYDYFNANAAVAVDPADPNIYAPFKYKNIYANWVDMPSNYSGTIDQYVSDQLKKGAIREYTPEERRSFMQKDVSAKMSLSPRLGIAFPITDKGVIHFSYGHFFQIPEFQYLYTNPDYKLTSGTGSAVFGNPDLKPQKTVMYELGLQQQLTEDIGVDLTMFYRDIRDWVGTSPLIKTVKTGVDYSIFENKDYENVRGITVKVEKRMSGNFSFRTDYTYQIAEGTYSNPQDAYNNSLRNQAPVLALVPMNWDQRHTLNAQIIYNISDWTFSLIGRYWSGQPYTPSFPTSEAVGASAVSGLTTNSAIRPDQKTIDISLSKMFRFGTAMNLELFMYVYNLFDQRDQVVVYGDTGTADYTTTVRPTEILYNSSRISTVEDFVLQPSWYTGPRQIQFGLTFGF